MSILKFFGFGKSGSQSRIKSIDATSAVALLSDGNGLMVDVREPSEWASTGRPAECIGLSLGDKDFDGALASLFASNDDPTIVFFCLAGGRSMRAAKKAETAGFSDIYVLEGGLGAWKKANLALEPFG